MLRNISYLLVGAIFTIGLLFKFMHWPGAGAMLITSLGGIAIALLEYAFRNRKSKSLILDIISPLLGVVYVLSVLFKVMHWPGAGIMLVISMIGLSCALAQFAFILRRSVYAILPLLFSITLFFVLFKIMHWPKPPYVLYGSYFAFALLVPVIMFLKGNNYKGSNASLSNHFLLLGTLSLVLFLFEGLNKATQLGKIDLISLNHLMLIDALLFVSLFLAVSKTLRIEQLEEEYENDYQLLKCLNGIYLIVLVLFVLIKAN
ncbi:MAG TPA: hypothetical protein EYN89_11190 [Flavobacteriales bacterium]|nr:hypothetical protein [Flavobacteriales bacterium]